MANSDMTVENAQATSQDGHSGAPVASDLEEIVTKLWAEVLGIQRVGLDEHFIALGGQSLQAVLLLLRVQQTFGVEVPFKTFLEGPTVKQLCVHIERLRKIAEHPAGEKQDDMASEEGVI